ncbi:glycoside hydrolase family 71/99-like protein [Planctomycetota bacterium]
MSTRQNRAKLLCILLIYATLVSTAYADPKEDVLKPYDGPSVRGVDPSTLKGKVMTGYQGWFNCDGDGADLQWTHWSKKRNEPVAPGNVSVDLWPDASDYDDDELYATGFTYADGSTAKVFSSYNRKTVIRHFKWMADYGIDGAFVQRFAHGLRYPAWYHHKNKVLSNAREGANRYGRTYAVMYDLTGLPDSNIMSTLADWQMLCDKMQITKDPAYQHHKGKPLVAIWGVGFNESIKKRSSLPACSVMLGIPTGWRERERDALDHPELHDMLRMADVLSPWTVGRFKDLEQLKDHTEEHWAPDIAWSRKHSMDYMPVIYNKGEGFNKVPRLRGKFFWSQVVACKKSGADMIYIAMFDEVDEGTAIFKCTNNPPVGSNPFLTLEGLPSDFYLSLAGQAGKVIRNEVSMTTNIPLKTGK